jgi:hypothetical protein
MGGDGDAAATVANAVKGGDGEEEDDADAAAALPHVAEPVVAPSVYHYSEGSYTSPRTPFPATLPQLLRTNEAASAARAAQRPS